MAAKDASEVVDQQPKRFDGAEDADLELPDTEVDEFRRFPQDVSATDDDSTDGDEEDCSLGTVLDWLVAEGIVGCSDPSLTLSVTHITDNDIEKLNAFGWSAMIHNDGDKTYLSLHKT